MNKPVIGIVPLVDAGRDSLWMLPGYMDAIAQAGGLGVMLPLTAEGPDIRRLLDGCGGVLLTGGQDVSPALYGETALPVCGELCPARDSMERELLNQALARDLAVLGICRGMQLLNAALGGALYQDLPAQRPSDCGHHMEAPYDREAHRAVLPGGTPLAELLGSTEIGVNSCHHQAVRDLAPSLAPMALAPDGVTEAVYMPEKRFVWGVQWHPEFSWRVDENSRKIFAAFVAACL